MRRLTRGVEIGRLRVFWTFKDWRSKPHPYFFVRNWDDAFTFQSMKFELFWRKF